MVNMYPNPTSDFLTIDVDLIKTFKSLTVEIRDIFGRLLIEENITKKTSTIDISAISSGYYFLSIKWPESYITKSFVKK
ncbi:MAG: hypothetical protein BWY70_02050 [Bacteroidetes bacterium ADurb.Bin408]|nr:MAG: hypothetical protein BWY70_02050 [Bacteroidetes bacterium ADurb.Bin408]